MGNFGSLLLLAIPVALLFMMFSRARRQQRQVFALQTALRPGQRIITTAGLHATIVELDGDVVVLETGPGQRSRWARRAVARLLDSSPEPSDDIDPADAETTDPSHQETIDASDQETIDAFDQEMTDASDQEMTDASDQETTDPSDRETPARRQPLGSEDRAVVAYHSQIISHDRALDLTDSAATEAGTAERAPASDSADLTSESGDPGDGRVTPPVEPGPHS